MCILFWTVANHPKYLFVFAGNRDEVLDRLTSPAHFWPQTDNNVLAGTDLEPKAPGDENGSWLGITQDGRFAALTNYREQKFLGAKSRGIPVRDYLLSKDVSVNDYMESIQHDAKKYGGFNLLCIDFKRGAMSCFSNREDSSISELSKGVVYGLSNSVLSKPWEKVKCGIEEFEDILHADNDMSEDELISRLFGMLDMTKPFSEGSDLNQKLEEMKTRIRIPLLSYFGGDYATRSSTVVLIDYSGNVVFVERDHYGKAPDGIGHIRKHYSGSEGNVFRFNIGKPAPNYSPN